MKHKQNGDILKKKPANNYVTPQLDSNQQHHSYSVSDHRLTVSPFLLPLSLFQVFDSVLFGFWPLWESEPSACVVHIYFCTGLADVSLHLLFLCVQTCQRRSSRSCSWRSCSSAVLSLTLWTRCRTSRWRSTSAPRSTSWWTTWPSAGATWQSRPTPRSSKWWGGENTCIQRTLEKDTGTWTCVRTSWF